MAAPNAVDKTDYRARCNLKRDALHHWYVLSTYDHTAWPSFSFLTGTRVSGR